MRKECRKSCKCMPPEQMITLATALSIALTENMTIAEIDSLSNFFNLLSEQTATISAQRTFCQNSEPTIIV